MIVYLRGNVYIALGKFIAQVAASGGEPPNQGALIAAIEAMAAPIEDAARVIGEAVALIEGSDGPSPATRDLLQLRNRLLGQPDVQGELDGIIPAQKFPELITEPDGRAVTGQLTVEFAGTALRDALDPRFVAPPPTSRTKTFDEARAGLSGEEKPDPDRLNPETRTVLAQHLAVQADDACEWLAGLKVVPLKTALAALRSLDEWWSGWPREHDTKAREILERSGWKLDDAGEWVPPLTYDPKQNAIIGEKIAGQLAEAMKRLGHHKAAAEAHKIVELAHNIKLDPCTTVLFGSCELSGPAEDVLLWGKFLPDVDESSPTIREKLSRFMDAAGGEGLVLGGVDAGDLFAKLFPVEHAGKLG